MISVEGTGKNQLEPGQESVGDAPVLSRCPLLRNLWPKLTSVLEHCHKGEPTVGSPFFSMFPSDRSLKATKDVKVHSFIHSLPVGMNSWWTMDWQYKKKSSKTYSFPYRLEIFFFLRLRWWFSFRRLLFCLWIKQEAPCFILYESVVEEFVVTSQRNAEWRHSVMRSDVTV